MLESSIVGLFKTVFIIVGFFVFLKFIGRLLIAKRNLSTESKLKDQRKKEKKQKEFMQKNMGKIKIIDPQIKTKHEDVEYEDISIN